MKDVTIAIHTPGTNLEEIEQEQQEQQMLDSLSKNGAQEGQTDFIKTDDVQTIRKSLKEIYSDVRTLASETKMSNIRQDSVNQLVEDNNNSSLYGAIIESIFFMGIAAAQVFYIRNMLESKRIIWVSIVALDISFKISLLKVIDSQLIKAALI